MYIEIPILCLMHMSLDGHMKNVKTHIMARSSLLWKAWKGSLPVATW